MKFCRHTLAFTICLLACNGLFASTDVDTIARRSVVPMRKIEYQPGDFSTYLQGGVRAIRADSVEEGLKLVSTGIKHLILEKKIDRTLSYKEYELISLLSEWNEGSLPKKLHAPFAKLAAAVITGSKVTLTEVQQLRLKMPDTEFGRRLKILLLTNSVDAPPRVEMNKFLSNFAASVSVNTLKAESYFYNSKYGSALVMINTVLNIRPDYAYMYVLKANCYYYLGYRDKMMPELEQALRLSPDYMLAINGVANQLLDEGRYREAIVKYKKVASLTPDYEFTDYNLASAYHNIDMPDSAMYYIDKYLQHIADDDFAYNLKGNIYFYKKDYGNALSFYHKAININNYRPAWFANRGDTYMALNDMDNAVEDYLYCLRLEGNQYIVYNKLGACYDKKKEYKQAISFYTVSAALNESEPNAYVNISLDYLNIENTKKAVEVGQKAVLIDSTSEHTLGNLGWAYYCDGDFDQSINYSQRALKYDKAATYAMFNIALATLRKGEFEKAKTLYRRYTEECRVNKYTKQPGVVGDLQALVSKGILVTEAKFIINNILKKR
jgi:tetratricopeptide (TPR) repeat protein